MSLKKLLFCIISVMILISSYLGLTVSANADVLTLPDISERKDGQRIAVDGNFNITFSFTLTGKEDGKVYLSIFDTDYADNYREADNYLNIGDWGATLSSTDASVDEEDRWDKRGGYQSFFSSKDDIPCNEEYQLNVCRWKQKITAKLTNEAGEYCWGTGYKAGTGMKDRLYIVLDSEDASMRNIEYTVTEAKNSFDVWLWTINNILVIGIGGFIIFLLLSAICSAAAEEHLNEWFKLIIGGIFGVALITGVCAAVPSLFPILEEIICGLPFVDEVTLTTDGAWRWIVIGICSVIVIVIGVLAVRDSYSGVVPSIIMVILFGIVFGVVLYFIVGLIFRMLVGGIIFAVIFFGLCKWIENTDIVSVFVGDNVISVLIPKDDD